MVRKKALEDERIKLASIVDVYNKQRNILEQMKHSLLELQAEIERYVQSDDFNPSYVANYSSFSSKLLQDIKTQEKIIEKTNLDLIKQQEIAKEAYIKVKSLENLKEKQKEQYNKEMLNEEFKLIDDITSTKRITA